MARSLVDFVHNNDNDGFALVTIAKVNYLRVRRINARQIWLSVSANEMRSAEETGEGGEEYNIEGEEEGNGKKCIVVKYLT